MSSRMLHVGNGHCTTRLIEAAGIAGRTMVWADPLNEGPVPGGISEDELVRLRAGFLAPLTPHHVDDVTADLRGWRAAIDDRDAYDELVLWFEHDLFDQLNLIQLLSHVAGRPQTQPASLVCIDCYPGHPNFKGLGELEPADLASLYLTRQPVGDSQLELASRAWQAFRASDPREIEALLATDLTALPFLSAAFRRHLQELPSLENGLSRSEHRLLEQARDGATDLRQIFPRMQDGETAYYITDSSLWDRVQSLALSSPALLSVDAPDSTEALPAATIALTPAGRQVLSGSADRVRLCGIDRWFGGVHARGSGPVWRWSSREARAVMA
jgi:hypothetical protein